MRLEGLHHITMITGDARQNVDFYADILGLRLVKQTVNFDAPEAYHLYFGDEHGTPGSILTWFEFAGAPRGRPGNGMIHTIELGVPSAASLDFWAERLPAMGYAANRREESVRFEDYDGLGFELVLADERNSALPAEHPEIPAEHAIVGSEGARAYSANSDAQAHVLTHTLGFEAGGGGGAGDRAAGRGGTPRSAEEYVLAGEQRRFRWAYDPPPALPGRQGAGTVHHIAWACLDADQPSWQRLVRDAGLYVTDVRDRDYFTSIYFREPHGILFEIATLSPGFAVDEDPEHLGEQLRVPKMHEHLRAGLERTLTPLVNPRLARREQTPG